MDAHALDEATPGRWKLGRRRERAKLAMALINGVVRAVCVIESWHPARSMEYTTRGAKELASAGRWDFVEREADEEVEDCYVGGPVTVHFLQGMQSPVVYGHCPRPRRSHGFPKS